VAHVDHEHGTGFAAEYIQIGNVKADILPCNWGIEMMGHWLAPGRHLVTINKCDDLSDGEGYKKSFAGFVTVGGCPWADGGDRSFATKEVYFINPSTNSRGTYRRFER
jgi:hypothetical protein